MSKRLSPSGPTAWATGCGVCLPLKEPVNRGKAGAVVGYVGPVAAELDSAEPVSCGVARGSHGSHPKGRGDRRGCRGGPSSAHHSVQHHAQGRCCYLDCASFVCVTGCLRFAFLTSTEASQAAMRGRPSNTLRPRGMKRPFWSLPTSKSASTTLCRHWLWTTCADMAAQRTS